jgi:hypothetical protein
MVQHLINQMTLGRPSQVGDVGFNLASPGLEREYGASALVHDGSTLALASVVPIKPAASGDGQKADMVVAIRSLADSSLREIGKRYGLAQLRFQSADTTIPAFAISIFDADSNRVGFLSWEPDRPGAALLPDLLMMIA